jgi:hypothetical protein
MSEYDACTWPEQDIIDAWLAEQKIDLPHKIVMQLKEAVTKIRIDSGAEANARADAATWQLNKLRRLKRKTWTSGIPDEEISRNEGWNELYDKLQQALGEQTP